MSVDNKPETVADPGVTPEVSTEQVVQQRMSEARQEIQEISNLVPKNQTGGNTDVSTQGGPSSDNNTNVVDLKKIEASAGRKFDNSEDFVKHYENLNSRNGDQAIDKVRKDAEKLAILEKQLGSTELNKLLLGIVPSVQASEQPKPAPAVEIKPQPVEVKPSEDEVTRRLDLLEHESQVRALEKEYPNATSVVDLIALEAKSKGISYVEAFKNSPLRQLVDLKVKEESQRSSTVTPSNRTNVDYQNLEKLGLKVLSGKAKEADQVAFAKEYFKTRGRDLQ